MIFLKKTKQKDFTISFKYKYGEVLDDILKDQ